MHTNPITGKAFHELADEESLNILNKVQIDNGYPYSDWATFQQWKKAGRFVQKNQKGTKLTGKNNFTWYVFNISQTKEKVDKQGALL